MYVRAVVYFLARLKRSKRMASRMIQGNWKQIAQSSSCSIAVIRPTCQLVGTPIRQPYPSPITSLVWPGWKKKIERAAQSCMIGGSLGRARSAPRRTERTFFLPAVLTCHGTAEEGRRPETSPNLDAWLGWRHSGVGRQARRR